MFKTEAIRTWNWIEFPKPVTFVSVLNAYRSAACAVLCTEPLDCRQHAVEMSAMAYRRKGEGVKFILFSSFQPQVSPLLYINCCLHLFLRYDRWNFADSAWFSSFVYRGLYDGHTLHLYGMIRRVLQGSLEYTVILFLLMYIGPCIILIVE